jgi:N-methylhydantoinase A
MGESKPEKESAHVGVDIGGTFTDLIWVDPTREQFAIGKTLTTPEDPSLAVERVFAQQSASVGLPIGNLSALVHGSTLVTNAIIERKGAITALITTQGFRDVLYIARQRRYDMYDLKIDMPSPLIPRGLCFEVSERTLADGTIARPLAEEEVPALAERIKAACVESLAICLLHGYRNPQHERHLRQLLSAQLPGLPISLSSDVAPEIREYERASTTVVNAYVLPLVKAYIDRLEKRLTKLGFSGRLYVMSASGGTMDPETAEQLPVRMIESGPAAGALAAVALGRRRREDTLISFDMGGTTAKVCIVERGTPLVRSEFETDCKGGFQKGSGLPIRARVVDMVEIGAGGGSLARWEPQLGRLKVGPQSAGADPGPAAYGRGGQEPTVTDADLILGYLRADHFLGGEMPLDVEAAQASLTKLGQAIGRDAIATAAGVHQVVNENMAAAARVHAVARGKDFRRFPLYAFGGAGPVHAYGIARLLGIRQIVVPFAAGVFSALGLLSAPLAFDLYHSYRAALDEVDWTEVTRLLDAMETEGRQQLRGAHLSGEIAVQILCEMRYHGQAHEVEIVSPPGPYGDGTAATLRERFEEAYKARYYRTVPGVPLEILTWGVRVTGPLPEPPLPRAPEGCAASMAKRGERPVYWQEMGKVMRTPVYDRYCLGRSSVIQGPAIVEERESTTVVGPNAHATVDLWNSLVIDLGGE